MCSRYGKRLSWTPQPLKDSMNSSQDTAPNSSSSPQRPQTDALKEKEWIPASRQTLRATIRATLDEHLKETEELPRRERRKRARLATKIAFRAMKELGPTPNLLQEVMKSDL